MQEIIKIRSKNHPNIELKAIPGHFVTPNSHINYFLDMTTLKTRLSEASIAARELGRQTAISMVVDTIVCIDGCEIIGAFLAEELTRAGVYSRNAHQTIYIVTPEYSASGQMLFRDNYLPMINTDLLRRIHQRRERDLQCRQQCYRHTHQRFVQHLRYPGL